MAMAGFWEKLVDLSARKVIGKVGIRHFVPSIAASPEDAIANDFLIDLAASAIRTAWANRIDLRGRAPADAKYFNVFPGEHYRLLKAITAMRQPGTVVEIGTYTGMGSVALGQGLVDGKIHTFDILPWNSFDTHLSQAEFDSGRLNQVLADLSMPETFEQHRSLLESADLIFLDAPKDGVFEYRLCELLATLTPRSARLLIIDDIKFLNMVGLWRSIASPKLDLTSFGHWSGTGMVDISGGLVFHPPSG
jgi:predicted O-methyltransferase YrrM